MLFKLVKKWEKFVLPTLSRGESAALVHFSVYIFFGKVDNKESKTNIVASQYNSLALVQIFLFAS